MELCEMWKYQIKGISTYSNFQMVEAGIDSIADLNPSETL
jgi:hypothetical protein